MDHSKPIIAIIASSPETRSSFLNQLQDAKFECFTVEVDRYLQDKDDLQARQLCEVRPQIVVVDVQEHEKGINTLRILHDVLPEAWLFVSAPDNNPELIIETMHAGAREFLPRSASTERLLQALERFSSTQKKSTDQTKGKIFGITSAKGGAGTTSVAINLAVATASDPDTKVSLVDFALPVGDVAEYLNLKSKYTVLDAIHSKTRLDPVLLESYMSSTYGISVLPGNKQFHSDVFQQDTLATLFEILAEAFTHTFIDMACAHDQAQLNAATKYCNAILIILHQNCPHSGVPIV